MPKLPRYPAFAVGAVFGFDRLVRAEVEREQAEIRLWAVTPPRHRDKVQAEVERRQALMGGLNAYRSVYDDVVQSRWPDA